MKILSLSALLVFSQITFADSATQTDWSGGGGVWEPVAEWSNLFHSSEDAVCVDPGWITLGLETLIAEHTLESDIDAAYSVYAEDVDGDGDMDVLRAANGSDPVTWWENVDGIGTSWIEHVVDCSFSGAISVYADDVDGDSDIDILVAEYVDDNISWCENTDGTGTSWIEHEVDDSFGAISIYAKDVDGDGDIDVLGAAFENDNITWCENANGIGTSWIKHTVDSTFYGARSVFAEDVDGDGDIDVLGAAYEKDAVTWWENANGIGTNWIEHTVDGNFDGAQTVYAEDVDGDGDMDVLGAAFWAYDITWWENANGIGSSWIEHTVDGSFRAPSVYAEDVDGDGDTDVLGAGQYLWGCITWWENADWIGTDWIEHTVDGDLNNAQSVYAVDIDGDGNMDILGADYAFPGSITWWDPWGGYCSAGQLESSVLDTQSDLPGWDSLSWNADTPAGTSVAIQVRASDDYTSMGAWSDTLTNPGSLSGILDPGDSYFQYRAILITSNPDASPVFGDVTVSWWSAGVSETSEPVPQGFALLRVIPNPSWVPSISFILPEPSTVSLVVHDLTGRMIREQELDGLAVGLHAVELGILPSGVYFCRMTSGDFSATERFVVVE
ncbi:MAG: T9SS type A sorting domain-containing protein [Candidatus Fermentibacteraceae bacterium]|nr:T9SS type A sorting domain-containing protein [Candidatus Fermentibacteraceae bacterium]